MTEKKICKIPIISNVILQGDAKEGWGNAELVTLHDWRNITTFPWCEEKRYLELENVQNRTDNLLMTCRVSD